MSGVRRAREFNGGDLLGLGCSGRRSSHGRWRIVFVVLVLLAILIHHGRSILVHHARVSTVGE
jgi:hypothetical protein